MKGTFCRNFNARAALVGLIAFSLCAKSGDSANARPASMQLSDGAPDAVMIRETSYARLSDAYSMGGGGLSLAPAPPVVSSLGTFDIVIVPGPALAGNLPALQAFNRAAAMWEAYISDPIVVTVNANMAVMGPSILGSANSLSLFGTYGEIRDAMVADAADEPGDYVATLLPSAAQAGFFLPPGFGLDGSLQVTKANAKALEFTDLDTIFGASDASITFNSNFNFDYDNSNGVTSGQHDFETVAAHEIGHALGFLSDVDYVDFVQGQNATVSNVSPTALDMFRFDNNGPSDPGTYSQFTTFSRSLVPGNAENFDQVGLSYNGAAEVPFSTGVTQGDGRQGSHWKDNLGLGMLDPSLAQTQIFQISLHDLRAFDLIGYEIAIPEPSGFALLGLGIAGWNLRRRRFN